MVQEQVDNSKKYERHTRNAEEIPGKGFKPASCWASTISGRNTHNCTPINKSLHTRCRITCRQAKDWRHYKISHGQETNNGEHHHCCKHDALVACASGPEINQHYTHTVETVVEQTANQCQG